MYTIKNNITFHRKLLFYWTPFWLCICNILFDCRCSFYFVVSCYGDQIPPTMFFKSDKHVCTFYKRPDPDSGCKLRFSLPVNEICKCERVIAYSLPVGCGHDDRWITDCAKLKNGEFLFMEPHLVKSITVMKDATKEEVVSILEKYAGINCKCSLLLKQYRVSKITLMTPLFPGLYTLCKVFEKFNLKV